MPSIWEMDKLILFIAFVIPGFVMLKTYSQLIPGPTTDSSKQVVDAVAYSCVNYALLSYPIFLIESNISFEKNPHCYVLFYASVLLVAPVGFAVIYKIARSTNWLQRFLPHPIGKPWDYIFGRGQTYWVIVTLADGEKIGGKYAFESFASSAPLPEQIYLEEVWWLNPDGGFERAKTDSAGIILISADIISVELFHITYGGSDD